jgi:hypothetical protein
MPAISGLRVLRSPLHGYGLVATRDFAEDDVITAIDGALFHPDEGRDDRHTLWLEDNCYLDIVDQARWINHSCDPNVWIDGGLGADGAPWAQVVALRAIRAGEEITCDYAYPADKAEPCACKAVTCRGWIVDEDELPLLEATVPIDRARTSRRPAGP